MDINETRKAHYIDQGLTYTTTEYVGVEGISVEVTRFFDEGQEAERDAFIALFAKSVGFRASTLSGHDETYDLTSRELVFYDKNTGEVTERYSKASQWVLPFASASFRFIPSGVTGAKNETGLKRLNSLLRTVEKNGFTLERKVQYISNNQPLLEEVLAAQAA